MPHRENQRSNAALFSIFFTMLSTVAVAGKDDISGRVTSVDGGEAGVWVIAETDDLKTTYRKIVVTDSEGYYLVPDLPEADYKVWVRGYGLLDTEKRTASPGDEKINLRAELAQTASEAAQIYPGNYWLSLLDIPPESEFPMGIGSEGMGIEGNVENQAWYVSRLKDGCQLCHQLGNKKTRELPPELREMHDTASQAWHVRLAQGYFGFYMMMELNSMGSDQTLDMLADWSNNIAAGAVPVAPPRPSGIERNLVITQWAWSHESGFVHDNVSTDKRNPTLYGNGQVYGAAQVEGVLNILDPKTNETQELVIPMRVKLEGPRGFGNSANVHNPMMDDQNRVWLTSTIRHEENPGWCMDSDHPSVKRFPLKKSSRQVSYYDVDKEEFVLIDTCFKTHHLQFDQKDILYLSGDYDVVGWIDTALFDKTGDEKQAQSWCPVVIDTNGDGKLSEYTEPGEPQQTGKDMRLRGQSYGIIPNPADGSIWFVHVLPDVVPGKILRLDPKTCVTEIYEPPYGIDSVPKSQWGHGPRGIDIDTNGIIWTALGGSGHIASFDRSKCKILNGPKATGQHCTEGWTLHRTPGPRLQGATLEENADFHYYIWVDQFNTLGLGKNVPIANGTTSDSLIAWLPEKQEMVTLRVPYPLTFYTRGLDGRIDDPKGGWKQRGVWASSNSEPSSHKELGEAGTGEIMHFQIRPNPLAE